MGDGWFYSEAGRTIGPVSIEAALRHRADPLNCLVRNGEVCAPVKDVPEVAELIFRAPDST
jgi:hypothetical protein